MTPRPAAVPHSCPLGAQSFGASLCRPRGSLLSGTRPANAVARIPPNSQPILTTARGLCGATPGPSLCGGMETQNLSAGCRGAHLASPRRQGSLSSAGSRSFSFQVEGSGKVFRRLPGLGVPTGSVFLAFAPQRLGRCLALGGRWTFVEGVKKRVRGRGGAGERHSARAEASDPRLGRFRASPVPSRGHSRRAAWRMRSCSALRAERRCGPEALTRCVFDGTRSGDAHECAGPRPGGCVLRRRPLSPRPRRPRARGGSATGKVQASPPPHLSPGTP